MVRLPTILSRILKRSHPDVLEATKRYAEAKGVDISDVVASALSAYLSADDAGKDELEKAMAERRLSEGSPRATDIRGATEVVKDLLQTYAEMSKAIAETRANFQVAQIVSDYKAMAEAAKELTTAGQSKGAGSIEDVIAQAMVGKLLGGLGATRRPSETVETGRAPVKKIDEEAD